MKFKLACLFVLVCSVALAQKAVTINITYLQPYCGGARPTEEIQKQAETPKPYAEKTIVYVSAKGKVDSAKTNTDGILKIKLKKGKYTLYEAWRYYLYTPENLPIESFDRECLKTEWQKAVYTVVVEKKSVKVISQNQIIKNCAWRSPCLLETAAPQVPE